MTNNTIKAAFLAGIMGIALPAMATVYEEPSVEIDSCAYSISFDRSTVNFGDVSTATVRYVTLSNTSTSLVEGKDCSVRILQLARTHLGGGYGSEAYTVETLGSALDDNMLGENESVEIKVTMTPDYQDEVEKYFVTALWAQGLGYKDDGSRAFIRATSRLVANEVSEYTRQDSCTYSMDFDNLTYSFGNVYEGASVEKLAVLTNTGTCAIKLLHQTVVGGETIGYSMSYADGTQCTPYDKTLLPGEKVDYAVTFSPSVEDMVGTYNYTMIYANALSLDVDGSVIKPFKAINTASHLNGSLSTEY